MQFLCPNGHKIHCPEDRAGQAARCPKCGVRFRIPRADANASEGLESTPSPSAVSLGGAGGDGQIEFLCPNNHLLHGPKSLQGKLGQCPHCGSKFRIPVYEEDLEQEEEDDTHAEIPVELLRDSGPLLPQRRAPAANQEASLTTKQSGSTPLSLSLGVPEASKLSSLGSFFPQLWNWKATGAKIEIHFGENQRLTPDHFLENWSGSDHGVFAVDDPDGTQTISVIAWDSISSVVAKGVKKLPG